MRNFSPPVFICILSTVFMGYSPATAAVLETEKLTVSADARLRWESDFNSQSAGGVERLDRHRARIRTRLGLSYHAQEWLSFEVRARTGSTTAQQSGNITFLDFSGNDTGPADVVADKWLVRFRHDDLTVTVGRDDFPFYEPTDIFWDKDATVAGLSARYGRKMGDNTFTLNAAYLALPAGMKAFAGELAGVQAVIDSKIAETPIKLVIDYYDFAASPTDPDAALFLEGNGARDYGILHGRGEVKLTLAERPLLLAGDVFFNLKNYDNALDGFTRANADETDGFVLSAVFGGLKEKGDWLGGYYFARIEQLAVNNSFAQDDWARFGGAGGQARLSNFRGHEFRAGYALTPKVNLLARLFFVEALTTVEDGNRFRLDLNIGF